MKLPATKRTITPTIAIPVLAPKTFIRSESSLGKMTGTNDQVNMASANSKTKSGKLSKNRISNFSGTTTTCPKCL